MPCTQRSGLSGLSGFGVSSSRILKVPHNKALMVLKGGLLVALLGVLFTNVRVKDLGSLGSRDLSYHDRDLQYKH